MKTFYRLLRSILVTAIILIAVLPAVLYVAMSLSGVQRRVADTIESELSTLLGARVTVGDLGLIPYNRVILRDVTVETTPGDTALTVRRLGASVSLWRGITTGNWRVNYLQVIGMDARLRRDSADAPLNIQPIIDALSPKDKNKPPTAFDLKISTVIIRSSAISYDVADAPVTDRFNPDHIHLTNFRADLNLPRITNDDFTVNLRRLAFDGQQGFAVTRLSGNFHIAADELKAENLEIELPGSYVGVGDIQLPLDGLNSIAKSLRTTPLTLALSDETHIWLPDLRWFYPPLDKAALMASISRCKVSGTPSAARFSLNLDLEGELSLDVDGQAMDIESDRRELSLSHLDLTLSGQQIGRMVGEMGVSPRQIPQILMAAGDITLHAEGTGSASGADGHISLSSQPGVLTAEGSAIFSGKKIARLEGWLETDGYFDAGALFPHAGVSGAEVSATITYEADRNHRSGEGELTLPLLRVNGRELSNISAHISLDNDILSGIMDVDDRALALSANGSYSLSKTAKDIQLDADILHFYPDRLGLWGKYPGAMLSGLVNIDMAGPDIRCMDGNITVTDLTLKPAAGDALTMHRFDLVSKRLDDDTARIDINSDWLDGTVMGEFDFAHIGDALTDILAGAFPALIAGHSSNSQTRSLQSAPSLHSPGAAVHHRLAANNFDFNFTIKETERPADFFHLPVSIIYPSTIKGEVSQNDGDLHLDISLPYLRQGSKLIERSVLSAFVDGREGHARLAFSTVTPTKGGPMEVDVNLSGDNNLLRSSVKWNIDRERRYDGNLLTDIFFSRDNTGLTSTVRIRRSELTFNDSTWVVSPATVTVRGKEVNVDGIHASHGSQFIKINGDVSTDPSALLTLDVDGFSLDYLFESLGIDAAMLGGDATGTFYASDLYSGQPRLETPGLRVKDISYNKTVLGDAVVRSAFDRAQMAVMIDADIDNHGRMSKVEGGIFATRDSLDLTFTVDRAPVGFLTPYMSAFASDIAGYASGRARVFGNFKYIDLEGDVEADSVSMRINFTNTTYWASDSLHIRPGRINLENITLHDESGHTALLNGIVRHTYFKEPTFEFGITGARGLLCYNETPKDNPRWYGRIYGDGSAFVKGEPGIVDINIDMLTAPGSTFTFVLSDRIEADEYSFLTFRDKNRLMAEMTDTVRLRDTSMDLVNHLRQLAAAHDETSSSDYNITIQMGVTPGAEINLVMDPVGGDRIRAYGAGHLRMDYFSANNELKMFGTYTLDRGDYNFTLQDIIIKDFTIKPGSEISFNGDPYAAQLDIRAAYSLTANLSDLDESFLNDSELNRTNVPVNAIMKVSGDIRQPEISFDLEFPTLTSDIYRKVRSIISTDEMMNRQILYLLALNRFYTPEYMAGATRGNELVSVASSTLSSQLSNILGQISDNWNIAPTLRSNRGDFSDVEVDVALSSRLLNNRLLFNSNFGYRDKSLNSNQFIGDFELEYLLNRSGNFRLKAYNRYNDQNYYLRSALTTQGVGIILRKDFDTLTDFLKPLLRRRKSSIPVDTILPSPTH